MIPVMSVLKGARIDLIEYTAPPPRGVGAILAGQRLHRLPTLEPRQGSTRLNGTSPPSRPFHLIFLLGAVQKIGIVRA
jgi:hypothetical protein